MSTTSTSEYGVKSAKELLEQGREPVASGEIDVSQVLDSGVKRSRKLVTQANVQPHKAVQEEKEELGDATPNSVVLPSPGGFSRTAMVSSVLARNRAKAEAKARADAEAGEASAKEMLKLMQAQMAAQQQQMEQMAAVMASSLADRRSAEKGKLAQAAMLAAMSPASQACLPRTEFEDLKEEFAPGLGELLENGGGVETVDKGGSFVFLDDALKQVKKVEGDIERVYRIKKENIPGLGDRSSKEIQFLSRLADMALSGASLRKVANELVRRIQALLLSETHGDWGFADVMSQDRPKEIVDPHLLHAIQRDRERLKKLAGGRSSAGSASTADALKREVAALKKKVQDQSKQLSVHEKFRREQKGGKTTTPGSGRGGSK
jgi:hypothetical protein